MTRPAERKAVMPSSAMHPKTDYPFELPFWAESFRYRMACTLPRLAALPVRRQIPKQSWTSAKPWSPESLK
jgi:hypothetical protein